MSKVNIGNKFHSNAGDVVTVIGKGETPYYLIEYNDSHRYRQWVKAGNIVRGKMKNPFRPSVYGVGYMGVGDFVSSIPGTRQKTLEYTAWKDMLKRCYSEAFLNEHPSYRGCSVTPEWHNFQVFATWYVNTGYYGIGFHLDKDLLYRGNKLYSPKTCCMLPAAINNMLISMTDDGTLGIARQSSGRYAVRLRSLNGVINYIGTYDSIEEAIHSRNETKQNIMIYVAFSTSVPLPSNVLTSLIHWSYS